MGEKKDNKSFIKKTINVTKKIVEQEGKKTELKKNMKKNKPKGMRARIIGMTTFWLLFLFMLLVTTVTIFGNNSSAVEEIEQLEERNKLYENEGLEFAKDFVHDYFTWTTDRYARDMRIHNLERYFLNNIDNMGGIIFDNEWSSSIKKEDIVFLDVQEINRNQARYIFRATFTLQSETDEEEEERTSNNLNFNDLLEQQNDIQIVDGNKVLTITHYISVPVYYDDVVDRFAIFDLPSFTYVDENRLNQRLEKPYTRLNTVSDSYVRNNINSFLNTFFETFARDGRDTISYILEDERHQYGLRGTMEYVRVRDSLLYHLDENNNRFIADTEVTFRDINTGFEFVHKYLLVIKRENQRYIIESLNDEQAVYRLTEEFFKSRDVNTSESGNNQEDSDREVLEEG